MEWCRWLQGGPFLEVSFLLEFKEEKKQTVRDIVNKLSKISNKIEIVDKNVDEIIDFFGRGYPFDEKDPQSVNLHSLRFRLYVDLSKNRMATLQIEMVSSNALLVNFWFNGEEFTEQELDQTGIKNEELADFTNFLKELYSVYEFKIGGIAIERDVLELSECEEIYPNECYRYENFSPDYFLKEPSYFASIIWKEKYGKLSRIPYIHNRLDKEGIIIETGSFHD